MNLKIKLCLIFISLYTDAFAQKEIYFFKVQNLLINAHSDSTLNRQLDSLKQTRRPTDSRVQILFDRDVDFGYKHKRIHIVFNNTCYYWVNLLVKNDSICFGSTLFDDEFGSSVYNSAWVAKRTVLFTDSTKVINYIQQRNKLYKSTKTMADLRKELELNKLYALKSGDGNQETQEKKHIDTLVKTKNYAALEAMLKSVNCETQMYGVLGFNLLQKKKAKISGQDKKMIEFIEQRNSDVELLHGDVGPFVEKPFRPIGKKPSNSN